MGCLARYLLMLYIYLVITTSFRNVFLPCLISSIQRIELLAVLYKLNPVTHCIAKYRQHQLVSNMIYNLEVIITDIGLISFYLSILIGFNTIMIGIEQQHNMLVATAVVFTSVMMVLIKVLFTAGCKYFSWSQSVVFRWTINVTKHCSGKNARVMKRLMKSLRVISMPAGGAGIVDEDIEINYYGKLQCSLLDTSIARKKLFARV